VDSLGVSIVDFRCRAHVEPLGPEEPNPTHGIVFVRKEVFRRKRQRETLVADANHVLLFNAGEPYRYSHPLPGGDEYTILALEGHRALELVGRHAPRDAESPEAPFRPGHVLASPLAARLHYELLALVRRGASKLVVEDIVAELADEAIGAAYRTRGVMTGSESASASTR
jgi:AraC family transcriptional regulator